jgi:three-Cys-motif partner protein
MPELADFDTYRGREHARVKHYLLTTYLERFLMILGQSQERLAYVDAFAGPWQSADENHKDTSFGLAWQVSTACAEQLRKLGKIRTIRLLWIEADPEAFTRLNAFADSCKSNRVKAEAKQWRFEDRVAELAKWIGDDYAFVLIDPKGYKDLISAKVLAPLLALPRTEVLINYMWQFMNFAAGQGGAANEANLIEIFGHRFQEIAASSDREERERLLLMEYEQRLREAGGVLGERRTRVMSFPVHYAGQIKAKYYLVYATHSAKGLITFAETSEAAAGKQAEIFFETHEQRGVEKTNTPDMFAGMAGAEHKREPVALTQPWLELLPVAGAETAVNEATWAELLERWRCWPQDLQKGLQSLLRDGTVANLDAKKPRTKHFIHYKEAERLKRLR